MERVIYLHQKNIKQVSLECRPQEEFGFDYETYDDYTELGDQLKTDVGLVNIVELIDKLKEMQLLGSTHVACDFHCHHVELDLYGVEYRLADDVEIEAYHSLNKARSEEIKQYEIKMLEDKLKKLKGE
jgi:hypothetical protein